MTRIDDPRIIASLIQQTTMRTLDVSRKRWNVLYSDQTIGVDLRQAVKNLESEPNPCEDGLRSVCWKAFLLYGPISQASWPKKLSESRTVYSSLREHFLKYIDHPDDLQSTIDPLADDASSPWNEVRRDEVNRGEIFQDVERCMQENAFFQEPSTQKILLDILFICSKLHPDVGYRQGMHEILAPILWVIYCDAIDSNTISKRKAEDGLMLDVLDQQFVEHDTFSLFCAIMQTAKSFYEIGDSTSPIVDRSRRIHDEYLGEVDPELATHLQVIEILPQIFLLRWIRLLFGREFSLKDTLSVWDVLFAENLSLSLIDMTCLAMILRIRWQLLQADHVEALQLLLHYEPPLPPNGPATLVQDAILLDRNRTFESGASLIAHYSGRAVALSEPRMPTGRRLPALQLDRRHKDRLSPVARDSSSPARSPARLLSPQKGLENLFLGVSDTLQKRTEGWKVPRAVREAVGEVRRNMNNLPSGTTSSRNSLDVEQLPPLHQCEVLPAQGVENLKRRLSTFEKRNAALARMIGDALEELRVQRQSSDQKQLSATEESFNIALAKIQSVQVYLADSEIPIPEDDRVAIGEALGGHSGILRTNESEVPILLEDSSALVAAMPHADAVPGTSSTSSEAVDSVSNVKVKAGDADVRALDRAKESEDRRWKRPTVLPPQPRPALAQSPLSWILGEGQHRSDFVSSSTPPPEQRRDSVPKVRPKHLFPDGKDVEGRNGSDNEGDGFTMSRLRGS